MHLQQRADGYALHGERRRAALPLLRNGAADRYGEVGVTSVGLYNHTPSPNLADSAFQCASVGFEETDTRGGKFLLSAPVLFGAPKVFSSTGNDGTAFRRSYDSTVPIHIMTEDDERFLRLPLSGRSASCTFPVAFVVPPFCFVLFPRVFRFRLFPNDRLWA